MSSHHRVNNHSAPLIVPSSGAPGTLVSIYNLKLKNSKDSVKVLLNKFEVPSQFLCDKVVFFQIPTIFTAVETTTISITVITKCGKLLVSSIFKILPLTTEVTAVPIPQPPLPVVLTPTPIITVVKTNITGVTPTNITEGTVVTVTGTNFLNGATVGILNGGIVLATVISSTELTFVVPLLNKGSYVIVVINPNGGGNSGSDDIPFFLTYN